MTLSFVLILLKQICKNCMNIFDLFNVFTYRLCIRYENSWGWSDSAKKAEMREDDSLFLIGTSYQF